MVSDPVDSALVLAWLTARSVARGLPLPVADRGGFRVDTNGPEEVKRWVFPCAGEGLQAIARANAAPRFLIKLCATTAELAAALPPGWEVQPASYMMIAGSMPARETVLPPGYRLTRSRTGATTETRVLAPGGELAASGFAAEAAGVFAYDRIQTSPLHRRKGLATSVMAALRAARQSPDATQILVATPDGRKLYESLGWRIYSPYSTASVRGRRDPRPS